MKGLYIHIPFCSYICTYCDFCKKFINKYNTKEYINYLIKELELTNICEINTIYIGGGTPSAVCNEDIKQLLDYLEENIIAKNDIVEYTIEVNPDDINHKKVELLSKYSINRISMGVQSLNNEILEQINRKYTFKDILNAYKLLTLHFDNISVDFMFNLPNEKESDINNTLSFIKENKIKHFSFYSLILEDNTVLNNQDYDGLNNDEESERYKYIQQKVINELGYNQYEISNFAFPGFESSHNKHYWELNNYYGVGLGAASYINNKRYTNTKSLNKYYEAIGTSVSAACESEIITDEESKQEKIILSLRQNKYVNMDDVIINKIKQNKYLDQKILFDNNKIKIDPKYYFISNEIILEILKEYDD